MQIKITIYRYFCLQAQTFCGNIAFLHCTVRIVFKFLDTYGTAVARSFRKGSVMGEEIFGPLMPIITFDDFNKTVFALKEKEKPLPNSTPFTAGTENSK